MCARDTYGNGIHLLVLRGRGPRMLSEITTLWHACIMAIQERTNDPNRPRKRQQFRQWAYQGLPETIAKMFNSLSLSLSLFLPPSLTEPHFLVFPASSPILSGVGRGDGDGVPANEEPRRTCTENKTSDYELNVTD